MINKTAGDSDPVPKPLKELEELTPNTEKPLPEKLKAFLDKSEDQPYTHMNEGYVVMVEMSGEQDATDALCDYLRRRIALID